MADISKHTKISLDDQPLPFGKYKGKTPNEVLEIDPQYLIWWYENVVTTADNHVSKNLYRHAKAAKDLEDEGFYDESMYLDINW